MSIFKTAPYLKDNELPEENHGFEYDLVVIGGGSGGLACAKAASGFGKKVACLDFVKPSPQGTTWGLGGTCVNVGCIPKKLMHQASIHGENLHAAKHYGWGVADSHKHDWSVLVQGVNDYIGSLNWGYRVQLKDKNVNYLNAYGVFVDPHTIEATDRRGKKTTLTSRRFVIAVGGRPRYPNIPGAKEHCITSDDIFWMSTPPGKTLVVGASYVALECAGFLAGLGYDTTVMIRSIPLRGFDQQCAEMIVEYMQEISKVNFVRNAVPVKVELDPSTGRKKVTWDRMMGEHVLGTGQDLYDTVLFAIGRDAVTGGLELDKAGVTINKSSGKIVVNDIEQSNIPHIYALGDAIEGGLELTPVAIKAGNLLAERLYANSAKKMDYINVPTTVFTPIEYGACGLPEEKAVELYGEANIEVYHSYFKPLEWAVSHGPDNKCYMKLVCLKTQNEKVIGFHVLSPNAGEITQAVGVAIKMGATKSQFDDTVGIHPVIAEEMTILRTTKREGGDAKKTGC